MKSLRRVPENAWGSRHAYWFSGMRRSPKCLGDSLTFNSEEPLVCPLVEAFFPWEQRPPNKQNSKSWEQEAKISKWVVGVTARGPPATP